MDQASGNETPMLAYDGRIGEIYRIFLINLLLTVVTLGIWRFWAITRMRRYIWSRTSIHGDRFEYDGKGSQLFVGFLIASAIILGMIIVAGLLNFLLRPISVGLAAIPLAVVYVAVTVLALGAPFSAQRYRLGHTVWHGIRGGMEGSMIAYGARSLLYGFAMLFTLFQLVPWASLRLYERRINASSFGSWRFVAQGRAGRLYGRFLLTSVVIFGLAVAVFGAVFQMERPVFAQLGNYASPEDARAISVTLGYHIVAAYFVFVLGAVLISASYQAAFLRHIAGHTRLGDIAFASDVSTGGLLKLLIGNVLLMLFTLGLGYPVVLHRTMRFYTTHVLVTGMLDLTSLKQSDLPPSRFGEGMFQVLDAGSGGF
jgi:uncharacterized membrane protein YjgN (DUF898 family)